jgi:hypothetical protein
MLTQARKEVNAPWMRAAAKQLWGGGVKPRAENPVGLPQFYCNRGSLVSFSHGTTLGM